MRPQKNQTFEEYLKAKYVGPYMATDIIIRYDDPNTNKNGIVLIERKYFPLGLALPGGMAEKMPLPRNAIKEAREETGLVVKLDNPNKPICLFSDVKQDPRAFIAAVTYTGNGSGELKPHEDEDAKSAVVYTLDEVADLLKRRKAWAFPHHMRALRLYLNEVRRKNDSK